MEALGQQKGSCLWAEGVLRHPSHFHRRRMPSITCPLCTSQASIRFIDRAQALCTCPLCGRFLVSYPDALEGIREEPLSFRLRLCVAARTAAQGYLLLIGKDQDAVQVDFVADPDPIPQEGIERRAISAARMLEQHAHAEHSGDPDGHWRRSINATLNSLLATCELCELIRDQSTFEAMIKEGKDEDICRKALSLLTALDLLTEALQAANMFSRTYKRIEAKKGVSVQGQTLEGLQTSFSIFGISQGVDS